MLLLIVKLWAYTMAYLLPLDAEAHLMFLKYYFQYDFQPAELYMLINVSLLMGLIFYFSRHIFKMFTETGKAIYFVFTGRSSLRIASTDLKMFNMMLVCLFINIPAYFLHFLRTDYKYSMYLVAIMMMLSGIMLRLSEIFSLVKKNSRVMNFKDAFIFAFINVSSFIPGVSRTALMMSAGKFLGVDKLHLIRMLFISLIPLLIFNVAKTGLSDLLSVLTVSWLPILLMFVLVIFFMNLIVAIVKSNEFYKFYYYLLGLGAWTLLDLLFSNRPLP